MTLHGQSDRQQIAGPGSCKRSIPAFPIPGPDDPQLPSSTPEMSYVFLSWGDALANAHSRIADAYAHRKRWFQAAFDAGLTCKQIGEATGLSPAAVHKIIGKQRSRSLDSPVSGS